MPQKLSQDSLPGHAWQTGAGQVCPSWDTIECSASFDYEKLLQESSEQEPTLLDDNLVDLHAAPNGSAPVAAASHHPPTKALTKAHSSSSTHQSADQTTAKKTKKQSPANARRKKRRQALKAEHGVLPTSPFVKKIIHSATTVHIPLDCRNLPATSGAYGAKRSKIRHADVLYTKEQLVNDMGFTYIPWTGRKPMVALDSQNRVCMVFVGRPNDAAYDHACETFHTAMEKAGNAAGLTGKVTPHTRGHFPVLNVGVIHGNGTEQPINLNNKEYASLAEKLLARQDCQRLASFASASLAAFAPKIYSYYEAHLTCLFAQMPELRRIFQPHISIFPTAALNFGPNVWTYQHRDILNCPFGLCAVQALGRFDHTKGGQIVLWEPQLVVEFPPGSLILIPSATITHSNLPVAEGDVRSSFTQYAPGGLFRYVDYGFQLERELKSRDPELYRIVMTERPEKWRMGLDLLEVHKGSAQLDT